MLELLRRLRDLLGRIHGRSMTFQSFAIPLNGRSSSGLVLAVGEHLQLEHQAHACEGEVRFAPLAVGEAFEEGRAMQRRG